MAELYVKQAKQYAEARPSYPTELFQFIASKTPSHDLVWDVGTGSGQAARSLAGIYKNVIGTDTSQKQLQYAAKLHNVTYKHTPTTMSLTELEQNVAPQSSVDLVTVAQALHWFDLPTFYDQVKWVLKKPHGVIAAWCYTVPEVNDSIDNVMHPLYNVKSKSYWDPARKLVDDEYSKIQFPFEPVEGADHTGPFKFVAEKLMNLDAFIEYIRSWAAYQTAKEKGVDILDNEVIEEFESAWDENGDAALVVKFPVYLRIGKGLEREVAEAAQGDSEELKSQSVMRLSWALVHSRQAEDVRRGIAMLEASLANAGSPLQQRVKIYLLAVGYYRIGDYPRSRQLVEQCFEMAPHWRQALQLKKCIEEKIAKDVVIGIGITATAVGLIAGGIAAYSHLIFITIFQTSQIHSPLSSTLDSEPFFWHFKFIILCRTL